MGVSGRRRSRVGIARGKLPVLAGVPCIGRWQRSECCQRSTARRRQRILRRVALALGRRQPALVLGSADGVLTGDARLECGSRPTRPHEMEAMARPLHAPHVAADAHCGRSELEQPRFCFRRIVAGVAGVGLRFRLPAQQALRQGGECGRNRRGLRPPWGGSIATDAGGNRAGRRPEASSVPKRDLLPSIRWRGEVVCWTAEQPQRGSLRVAPSRGKSSAREHWHWRDA